MNKSDALNRFSLLLNARRLSEGTIHQYLKWISQFLDSLPSEDLSQLPLSAAQDFYLKIFLSGDYAPSTLNILTFSLRYFYEGVLGIPVPSRFLPRQLNRHPKKKPAFSDEQVRFLFDRCSHPSLRAAILLGYDCGLRASEIVRLRFSDINKAESSLTISCSKRNRTRIVFYSSFTRDVLNQFVSLRYPDPSSIPDDAWVFNGRKPGFPLRAQTLSQGFKRFIQAFDFCTPDHSFHSLRHSFATRMASSECCSVCALQRAMGHASPVTTLHYVDLENQSFRLPGSPCDQWEK